jgi:hypothetical protein
MRKDHCPAGMSLNYSFESNVGMPYKLEATAAEIA